MHHTDVILRAANIRRILERQPGMPGLKDRSEHLPPEIDRPHLPRRRDFPALCRRFTFFVSPLERFPIKIVKIRHLIRAEKRPNVVRGDPLHEEIGDPDSGVHVMRAPAVVAGVLAQVDKLTYIRIQISR